MKITQKQLIKMIRECACEAMEDMKMPKMSHGGIKVISLKALPEPEHIHSTLFPGLEKKITIIMDLMMTIKAKKA